jgi:hypothetical protein
VHISKFHSSWVPGVFYEYFYGALTTPVVSALKNYYIQGFLKVPTDVLNHLWIQLEISLLKPPHGGFRIETAVT